MSPYNPHIDIEGRIGSDRNIGTVNLWAPITTGKDSFFFADLRFVRDNLDGQEFNAGLGYRQLSKDKNKIYGAYGFLDRRESGFGNKFNQITLGVEVLTQKWDLRLRIYR